jgi:hypothetical protein
MTTKARSSSKQQQCCDDDHSNGDMKAEKCKGDIYKSNREKKRKN